MTTRGPYNTLVSAGSTQATAVSINADIVNVTSGGGGVILDSRPVGREVIVINGHASASLTVYPPVGGSINQGTTDAGLSIPPQSSARFVAIQDLQWVSPAVVVDTAILGTDSSNTQVLFNDSGAIAGDSAMVWNKTTNALTLTTAAAAAVSVGRLGATTPAFVIDASTATSVTGVKITSAAATARVAVAAISSGTDEGLDIDAKGAGTIRVGNSSTGAITLARATTVTGAITPTGGVAAAGGFSASARNIHTGGVPAQVSTEGTNLDIVVTEMYVAEVFVPANCTVTGAAVLWGTNTNGNAKVALFNSAGTRVALSASTDVSAFTGASYGTNVAFSAPYAAVGPATYYVGVICDDNTNDVRTHILGAFGAGKIESLVYATEAGYATITPPTTFTTGLGPIASLY
jgi:hypothetical protein